MEPTATKIAVKWMTRDPEKIQRIRERFGIPEYTTVNGWSPAEISTGDMVVLEECQRRQLVSILPFTWRKNGVHFSFISRK